MDFSISHKDKGSKARRGELNTDHGKIQTPAFMPVGTLGGFPADDFHRSLDPETMRFTFEGVSGNLRQMGDVLKKIDSETEKWLRKNNPW